MPKALRRAAHSNFKAVASTPVEVAPVPLIVAVPRAPPQRPEELAAKAIAVLWKHLFASYTAFAQRGTEPFVVPPRQHGCIAQCPCEGSAAAAPPGCYSAFSVSNAEWGSQFSRPGVDGLVFHFYQCNAAFDTFSWVIAFCLMDRLQLDYYVQQRVRQVVLLQRGGAVSIGEGESNTAWPDPTPPFRLFSEYTFEALFAVYSLALKWHLDYSVSINYLVSLLPHEQRQRKSILLGTAALERKVLQQLKYNCFVHEDQVIQLLEHFLTATERNHILHAVNH